MKTLVRFTILCIIASLMVSCGKKGDDAVDISGEWKLESVGGIPADDIFHDSIGGLDRYICFGTDGSFETFERLVEGNRYMRYSGSYSVTGTAASGTYSDGSAWGAIYSVRIEQDGSVLVMSASEEDCVYKKTAVPSEVRSNSTEAADLKSASEETGYPDRFL